MKNYLNSINKNKLLPEEEVRGLIKKAQKGDINARNKVINANLRLVVYIAKSIYIKKMSLEDRIAYGNFGLFRAIDRFDLKRDIKFSTYATWWIRNRIQRALMNHGDLIRHPVYLKTKMYRYLKITTENPEWSIEKVAKKMFIPARKLKNIKDQMSLIASLNYKTSESSI